MAWSAASGMRWVQRWVRRRILSESPEPAGRAGARIGLAWGGQGAPCSASFRSEPCPRSDTPAESGISIHEMDNHGLIFWDYSDIRPPCFNAMSYCATPEVEEMLDTEMGYGEESIERVPPMLAQESRAQPADLDVRRRIEHMRELKRLRELLDDPDFDDLG